MKRKIALALLLVILMATLAGCKCKHEWQEADCITPKTCTKCKETEGEALGHTWVEVTCEEAKHCSVCGKTEGNPLGHDWEEATCTDAKVCKHCGETEGDPMGHTPGEWEYDETSYVAANTPRRRYCTVCGEQCDMEIDTLDSLHEDGKFLFTPREFADRLDFCVKGAGSISYSATFAAPEGSTIGCGIKKSKNWVASILCMDIDGFMEGSQSDSREMVSFMTQFDTKESDQVVATLIGIIMACDPTLDYPAAKEVCSSVVDCGMDSEVYEKNGIKYLLGDRRGDFFLIVSAGNIQEG